MADVELERQALALFERLLDVPEAEKIGWTEIHTEGDPALRRRLEALLKAQPDMELKTGGATDGLTEIPPPARIGAYRIVELIGHGGMGSVYRGERETGDFAHVAAIKVIKPGLLADVLIERFQRERQTLAALIHPHIARLYDGGETPEGYPYIVMEYVDGLPLLAWAEQHRATVAQRAALFCDVCDAVAFAHGHLVVHRDLTPANVLVTADGAAKLIDFGIARPAEEAEAIETRAAGDLSLTPGYAAPERMTSARVTTAADIYSLGRLLERLIPPADGDLDQKAIIARACAERPEDRYPTADALKADVQAWRTNHPVAARRGGPAYLFGKFVRRRPWMLGSATAAVLALAVALGVTIIANVRAEAARAEADARFQQTRAIAKGMLFDAYDEVSRAPGSTKARAVLARLGVDYLDALAADADAPRDVRLEAGQGYVRLAQVIGGGQSSQLGRYADANALLVRADGILSGLIRRYPDDPAVRRGMAELRLEQSGVNIYNNAAIDLARAQAQEAQRLLQPSARADARSAGLYITAIQAEGDTWGWIDDYAKARTIHLRAEAFAAGLPPALQGTREVGSARSGNLRLLGEAQHKTNATEPARQALDQAVALNRSLLARAPDDPALLRKLAVSLWYRAVVHRTNERDPEAKASIDEATALANRMIERDPSDAGALNLYALIGEVSAQILADAGRFSDSYAMGARVIAAHDRLVAVAGDAPGARRSRVSALVTYGGNFFNGGDYVRACGTWRRADAAYADLDRGGVLTETDRQSSWPELKTLLTKNCENGPPRDGMGDEGL